MPTKAHWASSPEGREKLSRMMKERQAKLTAANGHTRLALHTNIVLTINDRELTLTVSDAMELLGLLTAALSPTKVRDEAIA